MVWKSEKQKEDITLSIYVNYSCSLQADTFNTYESFFNKCTASYGVICVTLIKITF